MQNEDEANDETNIYQMEDRVDIDLVAPNLRVKAKIYTKDVAQDKDDRTFRTADDLVCEKEANLVNVVGTVDKEPVYDPDV